jgi:hypothetical protein
MIESDFGFRGILAANKLPKFRVIMAGRRYRRDNPDGTGTPGPSAKTGSTTHSRQPQPPGATATDYSAGRGFTVSW